MISRGSAQENILSSSSLACSLVLSTLRASSNEEVNMATTRTNMIYIHAYMQYTMYYLAVHRENLCEPCEGSPLPDCATGGTNVTMSSPDSFHARRW